MAFFEELKGISEGSANDPSIELLKVLIERHKKALLDRHLETVYEGLKDTIRERISAGDFEQRDDKKRVKGAYRFKAFVPMSLDFEEPYPDGVTPKMVKEAVAKAQKISITSRVRLEPNFRLEKTKHLRFGAKVKYEGEISLAGDTYTFFKHLSEKMTEDGIKLKGITIPILGISRLVSLSAYDQIVKCSYTDSEEREYSLNYDESSFITIKYSITF